MKTILNLMAWALLIIPCKRAGAEVHPSKTSLEITTAQKRDINSENDNDNINYVVTIDKTNYKLAKVSMTFTPKNKMLYMAQGADHLPNRWATFVHNLKAVGANGSVVPIEELSGAQWKLQTASNEKITVRYEVRLDHEDHTWSGGVDGAAYATDWGVFYTGRSLFILNGDDRKTIGVDFVLPSGWKVTTPFDPVANTQASYVANNLTALGQSMLFAGTHEEISFKRDDFELVFALGGEEIIAQKEEFKNLAEGVLDYYIALMGGIPNPSANNAFKKSIAIINSYSLTDGEQIGNNISMLIEKNGNDMSKMISRFIFAHEFFHLWNGKSFWPVTNEMEWFKEGFTNYYTLKSLYHVGFLNDSSYLDVLNSFFFQRYATDDGVGKIAMTRGDEKHDHWGLIYSGGFFVAISQDMIIRKATNNKKSVDDVLKGLFQKYGGTNEGYALDELLGQFSKLSGKDQSEFFNNYVKGVERIPLDTYLSMSSLEATIENGALRISKKKTASPLEEQMTQGLFGIMDLD